MNWLQKIGQDIPRWSDGDLAILSSFGWRDFSVVEVLSWENVSLLSDEYQDVDKNTIRTTRQGLGNSWKRGTAVPFKVLNTYSDSGGSGYYVTGKISFAGPQNLYHTLESLMKEQSSTLYPDITMTIIQKPHIAALSKDFPALMGSLNISEEVDYQIFDINGYETQIINDKRAVESNPAIMQTRGTEGMYYWHIPELQTRSFDRKEGIDQSPWGTGRYPTMQRAIESAEQYINYLFYGKS